MHPTGLQIIDDTQPEVCALATITNPVAEYIAMALQIDAQDDIDCSIRHLAVAPQLEVQGIKIDNRVDSGQRPALPGFNLRPDLVGDRADCRRRDFDVVDLAERLLDVAGRDAARIEVNDLLLELT